jgi:two-component system OmpR family sensor kinase
MFSTLRSRLLFSYLAVIVTALFIVALALLAASVAQRNRLLPALRQLAAVSLGLRREVVALASRGADLETISDILEQSAAEQEARVLLLNRNSGQVVFDTGDNGESWRGRLIKDVVRLPGEFASLDPNLPIGRYRAQDGSRWLVYAQPLTGQPAGRLLLLAARPEPTVLGFFRQVYLRPLYQAGLVAFLLSVLLAMLIARSVARPLQGMAEASEAIAQGDYQQQLPLSGPDEVRRVAASFNEMAAQVAASQQAQRDLVANISHDLRTPLTSIRGWSQALLDGTAADGERQQQAATVIHSEAGRMQRMVEQLLDLARMESGQLQLARQAVDLGHLLSELKDSFEPKARDQGVALVLALQPAPAIMGDRDRLAQVFANLLDNALDHTPAGGQVRLALYLLSDGQVEVDVQDNGRGIPQEELSRIFERFYQVDKSRAAPAEGSRVGSAEGRGSGLGLAIVRELVEAHGGQITARSAPGQDTVFAVRLPAVAPDSD